MHDGKLKYFMTKQVSNFKYNIRLKYESLERTKDRWFIKRWNFIYENNFFYKKIRPKSQRYFKRILATWTNTCPIIYHQINNQDIGFYYQPLKTYKNVSTHIIENTKILDKIEMIFYIPIKYNVYSKFIDDESIDKNDFEFLKNKYEKLDVNVVDLTELLQLSAEKYLQKGKFIYWRDDTHWNINGINEVMENIRRNYIN